MLIAEPCDSTWIFKVDREIKIVEFPMVLGFLDWFRDETDFGSFN